MLIWYLRCLSVRLQKKNNEDTEALVFLPNSLNLVQTSVLLKDKPVCMWLTNYYLICKIFRTLLPKSHFKVTRWLFNMSVIKRKIFEAKKLLKVFKFIDPLLIYIVVIYGLSQIYQWLYDVESVWQTFWEKVLDLLGKIAVKKYWSK